MNIQLNTNDFEMDVRALVMAFFPKTELEVFIGDSALENPPECQCIRVHVDDEKIYISYRNNRNELTDREEPSRYTDRSFAGIR